MKAVKIKSLDDMEGDMTAGGIALIILASAVMLFVIFLGIFMMRLTQSLGVVTRDVDIIAREANDIMANANTLLNDVNGKVATIDPAFQAIADVGTSVSDLNDAVQNVTTKLRSKSSHRGTTGAAAVFAAVNGMRKAKKKTDKASKESR